MSIEVLVPAGSFESLVTAVNNGADAVYLGGSSFSARANAVNFSDDEIELGVRYAHVRGAKVYVALNTLVEDDKLYKAYEFAKFCYKAGVDALIVQDLGILSMLRKCFPDFKLNGSTQMTIHNLKGVRAAEKSGLSRVVLSRELSKEEIGKICADSKAEIEIFAHGALCMCYSGQCLMSSFIGARSGNRGDCAQPCRLPYTLLNHSGNPVIENKYLLSLKDLCLIDNIGDLESIGVNSIKIEGRMKSPSYVAMTSNLYNKYRHGGKVDKADIDDLQSVFSRNGFTKGYFENNTGRHMLNMDDNNDNVYKNITQRAKERAEELVKNISKKIKVSVSFTARLGDTATLCVWDDDGNSVTVNGNTAVEKAIKVALAEERISEQLRKTGGTPFEIDELILDIGENISMPVKEINDLRRRALEKMENERSLVSGRDKYNDFSFNIVKSTSGISFTASASNYEQAKALSKTSAKRIYIPQTVFDAHKGEFSSDRYFVTLPAIERFGKEATGYERICTSNFSQIYDDADVKHGGFRMNVFNSMSVKFLAESGFSSACLSPEMNMAQIKEISKDIDVEVIAYGYLPVMTVQNCVIKSAYGKCSCDGSVHYLKDRKGVLFPVINDKDSCTNIILNSAPIYMGDKMADLSRSGVACAMLNFTTESSDDIYNIFKLYENGLAYDGKFTRGHFYRGV